VRNCASSIRGSPSTGTSITKTGPTFSRKLRLLRFQVHRQRGQGNGLRRRTRGRVCSGAGLRCRKTSALPCHQLDHSAAAGVVAGQRLLDVPEVTANTTLSYKQPLDTALNLIARLTNSYVDSIQDITFTRNSLPAYDLVGFAGESRRTAGPRSCSWITCHEQDGVAERHRRPLGEHLDPEPRRHESAAHDWSRFEFQVLSSGGGGLSQLVRTPGPSSQF
jgi:hypothetical protein